MTGRGRGKGREIYISRIGVVFTRQRESVTGNVVVVKEIDREREKERTYNCVRVPLANAVVNMLKYETRIEAQCNAT